MSRPNHGPNADQREAAMRLLNSPRGALIIGQALAHAIATMQQAEHPEVSNIGDMQTLGEMLFQPWFTHFSAQGAR